MCVKTGRDFFKQLAKGIREHRQLLKQQREEAEIELLALNARLSRLRMWNFIEVSDGCVRLRRALTL